MMVFWPATCLSELSSERQDKNRERAVSCIQNRCLRTDKSQLMWCQIVSNAKLRSSRTSAKSLPRHRMSAIMPRKNAAKSPVVKLAWRLHQFIVEQFATPCTGCCYTIQWSWQIRCELGRIEILLTLELHAPRRQDLRYYTF